MGFKFDADDAIERLDLLTADGLAEPNIIFDKELMAAQLAISFAWTRPSTEGVKTRNPNALKAPTFRDRLEKIAPCENVEIDELLHGDELAHIESARTIASLAFSLAGVQRGLEQSLYADLASRGTTLG